MAQVENIYFTDDGTLVFLESNLLVDGLKLPSVKLVLDYGTSRTEAREAVKKFGIKSIVLHEETKMSETLLDDNIPHIDDFGLNVYIESEIVEGNDQLIDTRFEIPKPPAND